MINVTMPNFVPGYVVWKKNGNISQSSQMASCTNIMLSAWSLDHLVSVCGRWLDFIGTAHVCDKTRMSSVCSLTVQKEKKITGQF